MARLWRGLKRRSSGFARNPRHFVQLLLPSLLILGGWVALAFGWWAIGVILVSAALFVFTGLIWLRLRRIQARIDRGLRMAAARPAPVVASVTARHSTEEAVDVPPPVAVEEAVDVPSPAPAEEENQSPSLPLAPALPACAVLAGLPTGLLRTLDAAVPTTGHNAVLLVPSALRSVATTWVEETVPGQWSVFDEQSGVLRSRAAGAYTVVILDSEDFPVYGGVLDRSFFWWLPRYARLFLVSPDAFAFAARLAREHDVDFALAPSALGSSQASVTRKKGDCDE